MFLDDDVLMALIGADLRKRDLEVLLACQDGAESKDREQAAALGMAPSNFSRSRKKVSPFLCRPLALDVCCGECAWHEDGHDCDLVRIDARRGTWEVSESGRIRLVSIEPDALADFRALPFGDGVFSLVAFDPPHLLSAGEASWLNAKYGRLDRSSWKDDLAAGFSECWRVLARGRSLFFKWNSEQVPVGDVLKLFPVRPLLGTQGGRGKTYFKVFLKS